MAEVAASIGAPSRSTNATSTALVPARDGRTVSRAEPVGVSAVRMVVDDATSATFAYSLPSADLGPITRDVVKTGPGTFASTGRDLSIAGDWTIVVTVRTGDFTEQRVEFTVPIRP